MTLQPWKKIGLLLGVAVFVAMLLFYNPLPEQPAVGKMAAIAAFMAILWITEAIPLGSDRANTPCSLSTDGDH